MSDASLSRSEVAKLRKLIETHGLVGAAKLLSVHPAAANAAAGITPAVRPSTLAQIRAKLAEQK
jgi:hypothetical protein